MSKQLQKRPVYLNLFKIKLPVTGLVSIAHRISGVLLVIMIAPSIYLLQRSLHSEEGFIAVSLLFDDVIVKGFVLMGVWALSHHLFTGIRFLLIDMHIGVELRTARFSAWLVGIAAILITLLIAFRWMI